MHSLLLIHKSERINRFNPQDHPEDRGGEFAALASWHALKVELARVDGDGVDVVSCKTVVRRECGEGRSGILVPCE